MTLAAYFPVLNVSNELMVGAPIVTFQLAETTTLCWAATACLSNMSFSVASLTPLSVSLVAVVTVRVAGESAPLLGMILIRAYVFVWSADACGLW